MSARAAQARIVRPGAKRRRLESGEVSPIGKASREEQGRRRNPMRVAGRILVWRHQDLFQGVRRNVLGTSAGAGNIGTGTRSTTVGTGMVPREAPGTLTGKVPHRSGIGEMLLGKRVVVHCGQHFAERSAGQFPFGPAAVPDLRWVRPGRGRAAHSKGAASEIAMHPTAKCQEVHA